MFSNEAVWIFQRAAPCCFKTVGLETLASAALCHPVAVLGSLVSITYTAPSPRLVLVRVVRALQGQGTRLHRLSWSDWILSPPTPQVNVHPVTLGWDSL